MTPKFKLGQSDGQNNFSLHFHGNHFIRSIIPWGQRSNSLLCDSTNSEQNQVSTTRVQLEYDIYYLPLIDMRLLLLFGPRLSMEESSGDHEPSEESSLEFSSESSSDPGSHNAANPRKRKSSDRQKRYKDGAYSKAYKLQTDVERSCE